MNSIEDFPRLRTWWENETGHLSNLTQMVSHPAYLQIIGLGPAVLPLLLADLELGPQHWFVALSAITGEDPGRGEETVEGARQRWLTWGHARGLLT